MENTAGIVTIHPVHNHAFTVSEHPEGQLAGLGDALGCDCVIERFVDGWLRKYRNDGLRNEDWYGWGADVLAPFDGIVESVYVNDMTNEPGTFNPARASMITFLRDDGVRVCYAHVREVKVREGDSIKAGEAVAKVGNDGYARHPHIHVGAWNDGEPLQIRFDLQAMGRYLKELGDRGFYL